MLELSGWLARRCIRLLEGSHCKVEVFHKSLRATIAELKFQSKIFICSAILSLLSIRVDACLSRTVKGSFKTLFG